MADEGIRAATEVGDVDRIEPGIVLDDLPGGQDPLSVSPVHLPDLFRGGDRFQRKEVHRDGEDPQVPQFLWNLKIDPGITGVIGPADDDHHLVIRADLIQDLLAPVEQGLIKEGLESFRLLKAFFTCFGPRRSDFPNSTNSFSSVSLPEPKWRTG